MDDYKLNLKSVKKFRDNFINQNHIYQIFYKEGGASKQEKIGEDLLKYLEKNKGKGLQCVSINPRNDKITGFESVKKIRNLLFDIDVVSEHKNNGVATQEALNKAKETVYDFKEELENKGFDVGCIVYSGNGYHLYIPIDLEFSFDDKQEWRNSDMYGRIEALEELGKEFAGEMVEVDSITKDVVRRVKVPGTWNVKPEIDPDDYIRSRLVDFEDFNRNNNLQKFLSVKPKKDERKGSVKTGGNNGSEIENYDKFRKRFNTALEIDEKFSSLFDGNCEGYKSRSEAEQALAVKCVYYGLDPYEVFRRSGMEKWKEKGKSYRDLTVKKAKNYIDERFDWEQYSKKGDDFSFDSPSYTSDEDDRVYRCEEGLQCDKGYGDLREMWKSDDINKNTLMVKIAKRLMERYKFITPEKTGVLWFYRNPVYVDRGDKHIEREISHHFEDLHSRDINEIIKKVNRFSYRTDDEITESDSVVALKNGWYNLDNHEMLSPDPDLFVRNELNVEYNPDADCPKFKNFLKDRIPSYEDRKLLQEFLGTALLTKKIHKNALIIVGQTDSGKSTLLKVLRKVFGDSNVVNKNPKRIADSRWAVSKLHNKLLNVSDELSSGFVKNVNILKQIFDGNKVTAETKGNPTFEFEPFCEHIFAGNQTFRSSNPGDAFWNRLLVIEMPDSVPEEEKRAEFHKVLLEEKEGIFNWMIEGLKSFQGNSQSETDYGRFTVQRSVDETKNRFLNWSDSVRRFIHKCVSPGSGKFSTKELHDMYVDWVDDKRNLDVQSQWKLTKALKEVSYVRYSRNFRFDGDKKRGFKGLEVDLEGLNDVKSALEEDEEFSLFNCYFKREKVKRFLDLVDEGDGVPYEEMEEFFAEPVELNDVLNDLLNDGEVMEVKPGRYSLI